MSAFDINSVAEQLTLPVDTIRPLVQRFIETYATFADDIARDVAAGDVESACRQAHSLKGIAATLLAQTVSDHALALEIALRDGDEATWPDALAAVTADLDTLLDEMRASLAV